MIKNFSPEQIATLRLMRGRGIGPVTFFKMLSHYKTALNAVEDLENGNGKFKPASVDSVEKEIEKLAKMGATLVFYSDDIYPTALRHIADFPPVLAAYGRLELLAKPQVAIVGARNASINGCRLAQTIAQGLSKQNWGVASGLARGVDTAAHIGALKEQGSTIAVLGGGLDHIYPPENKELFHKIANEGLLLAETPLGTKPTAQSFPRRNRIVSGLSAGVVVVEAARHSGSLITAQQAGEQGREVMAVPNHPSEPRGQGGNHLIRQGATLVQSAEDILEAVAGFNLQPETTKPKVKYFTREQLTLLEDPTPPEQQTPAEPSTIESRIKAFLSTSPTTIDDLLAALNIPQSQAIATLTELELDGEITRHAGGKVALVSK